MPYRKPEFSRQDVQIESDRVVYDGFFNMHEVRLKHRLFKGGWTSTLSRELFHRGEASAAVLYDPRADHVGLVEQFRVGALDAELGPWCMEVVAGMLEKGESPKSVIKREIKEEAGVSEVELVPISSYFSTPGGCSEKVHLYCALCDLRGAGGIHGLDSEDEDIRLHVLPADEVFAALYDGRLNNAATLIGLQWLQINRESLRH